ncbi:hypothetical protein HMPREF9120_02134 [Neisseria sp. oral taxon 020 str. F0370]|nr:hypothetical protein HMPREF9120_02134 [Neisseria sp. oral taxon 020 str. F0370]
MYAAAVSGRLKGVFQTAFLLLLYPVSFPAPKCGGGQERESPQNCFC